MGKFSSSWGSPYEQRRLGGSNEPHEALAIGLREPQLGVAALDEHQTFLLHLTVEWP